MSAAPSASVTTPLRVCSDVTVLPGAGELVKTVGVAALAAVLEKTRHSISNHRGSEEATAKRQKDRRAGQLCISAKKKRGTVSFGCETRRLQKTSREIVCPSPLKKQQEIGLSSCYFEAECSSINKRRVACLKIMGEHAINLTPETTGI
jgi:hypothetical protein